MSNRNEIAPGKGLLKVTGIFYIILGAISIITSLLLMDTANAVSGIGSLFGAPNLGVSAGIRWIAFYNVFVGIFSIIIGISGISYCEDLEKANLLGVLAVIDIVLSIISLIAIEFSWTSLIFMVLPICFLIGALKNSESGSYSTSNNIPYASGTLETQRAEAEREKAAREQSAKEKAEKQKGETDQIIANYRTALHDNPDDAKAYEQRGSEFCDKGYFDLGIADYTQVIRINPDNAAVYRLRGIAYSQIRDYNKAIADYDNAIRLKPDDSEAFSHRGMAYSQKQEYDKAIADFNEALRLDPHNANAYFGRGFAYKQTGNYDQAIADCEFVLRVEPNNTVAKQVLEASRNLKEKAAQTSAEKARRYSQLLQSKDKASTEEQYRSLVGEFRAMNGYENTAELANECESQYQALKKHRDEEAARKAKKEKTRKLITTVFVIVAIIGVIVGYVVYSSQEFSLTIPDSVTIIKTGEYKGKRLIHVDIPDSVTSIGDEAFKKNKLTSITIPDSVTTIGSFAFAENQLTSITIGANVTLPKLTLGNDVFGFGFDSFYNDNGKGAGTYTRPNTESTTWTRR